MNRIIRTSLIITTVLGLGISMPAIVLAGPGHDKPHNAKVKKEQKDWGIAGDAKSAKRTIGISMGDNMRFTPEKISVKQGDTIKFVITNSGKIMHEFVIGTKKDLDAHAAMMVKFPTMEHDEPYMAHVAPGKKSEIIWTFNKAGEFDFACLIAGHYQAGMVGKISVQGAQTGMTAAEKPTLAAKATSHTGH